MSTTSASHLAKFILGANKKQCLVLTGAGCSTESGIPDYRGPTGLYRQKDFVPLTYQNFLKRESEQKRYWARSLLGYSFMVGTSCNAGHLALNAMAREGIVSHIVTQNVDGLHHLADHGGIGDRSEAGHYKYYSSSPSNPLTELHGNIHLIECLKCGDVSPRVDLQHRLRAANEALYAAYALEEGMARPDGDFQLPSEAVDRMNVVGCVKCGGLLKPRVVLFGENVRSAVVEEIAQQVRSASCLLCIGTSLQVFSAFRYVMIAKEHKVPVVVVNAGKTRADDLVDLKIHTETLSDTLQKTLSILQHQ